MRSHRSEIRSATFGAIAIVLMSPSLAAALQPGSPKQAAGSLALPAGKSDSATIAAGAHYQAGGFRKWLDGNAYRDLWTTPIRVPVLDLRTFAGGLKPTKQGGGMQTKNLRFETPSGQEYVFRLVDKGATGAPPEIRSTPVNGVLQDQVSAMHPAGAEIAAPIVEAAGVLHPTAVLVVMPDDSTLGKFRQDFAGRLGMIEEFPNVPKDGPGFGGAKKIIDSPDLLKLLNTEAKEHVDARALLTARLTDFLINDNDRHSGQWKWARLDSGPKTQWEPIARDRDHAFVSYGGFLAQAGGLVAATLVPFNGTPIVPGLTYPRDMDVRLLTGLEKPVWDSVARALQARITDSVLDAAVHAMPREYQSTAPRLEALLKERRAALPKAADSFYRDLAAYAQVHGTDSSDRATITRASGGGVEVRLESGGEAYFSRRFDRRDTREILVFLHGGDDTAIVTGNADRSIVVRVIGGNGTNTFVDSSTASGKTHPTHFYDSGPTSGVSYGLDTLFERLPWEERNGKLSEPPPNSGAGVRAFVGLSDDRTIGYTPRIGAARYTYGFLDRPYSSLLRVDAEYSASFRGGRVAFTADRRMEDSPWHFPAFARVSDLQFVDFHGFGNATIDSVRPESDFYVHQRQWLFNPAVGLAIGQWTDVSLGPVIQRSVTDSARSPLLREAHPYGFGTFDEAGLQLAAHYERGPARDNPTVPRNHFLVEAKGQYYPAMMDVRSSFGEASLASGMSLQLPLPTAPTLVARAGGKKLYGDFPFFEAATLGGMRTTRFMETDRYAGDASLYGTTELLVPLARFKLWMPARAGIAGVADAGRVYFKGSSPDGWHTVTGEGIWVGRTYGTERITLLRTTEPGHTGLQLRLGLAF